MGSPDGPSSVLNGKRVMETSPLCLNFVMMASQEFSIIWATLPETSFQRKYPRPFSSKMYVE